MTYIEELKESVIKKILESCVDKNYSFIKDSIIRGGAEKALDEVEFVIKDYFLLLNRLKGTRIHSGKSLESLEFILCEQIPSDAEKKLEEFYKRFNLRSARQTYYDELEEG